MRLWLAAMALTCLVGAILAALKGNLWAGVSFLGGGCGFLALFFRRIERDRQAREELHNDD